MESLLIQCIHRVLIMCRQVYSPTIIIIISSHIIIFITTEYTFRNAATIDEITRARGKACEYACVEAYSLEGDLTCDEFYSVIFIILSVCKMHIVFYGLYVNPTRIHICTL